jgi:acyl-CoA thioesterase I
MKKILCIGDSLALPGHLNKYEDTWLYKLKCEFPHFDFITFFKRQLTTEVLTTMGGGENGIDGWPKGADCLEAYLPDIVIIQLGIVDCAPRLLNRFDKIIIKLLPSKFISNYIEFIKRIRVRKSSNTIVKFYNFKRNIDTYISRCKKLGAKVIFISISLPDDIMVNRNPRILENITKYNQYIECCAKIDFVKVTMPLNPSNFNFRIYEDGYHPNPFGNNLIFNQMKVLLNGID